MHGVSSFGKDFKVEGFRAQGLRAQGEILDPSVLCWSVKRVSIRRSQGFWKVLKVFNRVLGGLVALCSVRGVGMGLIRRVEKGSRLSVEAVGALGFRIERLGLGCPG